MRPHRGYSFFRLASHKLLLCADRPRSLPVIGPYDREPEISCGAALFNLRVVFARFAIPAEIHLLPREGDPDIRVSLSANWFPLRRGTR